jgi:hypothetical protein
MVYPTGGTGLFRNPLEVLGNVYNKAHYNLSGVIDIVIKRAHFVRI